jgi:hypothetical protein
LNKRYENAILRIDQAFIDGRKQALPTGKQLTGKLVSVNNGCYAGEQVLTTE